MSSPTHLPRCLRDACSLWLDDDDDDPISGDTLDEGGAQRASHPSPAGTDERARHEKLPTAAKSPFATVGNGFDVTAAGGASTKGTNEGAGADRDMGEEEGGEEREKGRRRGRSRRRPWRPVVLASPSGTNFADYGAADVVVIEPPHRGDSAHVSPSGSASNGGSCSNGSRPEIVDPVLAASDEARRKLPGRCRENGETAGAGELRGKKGEFHSNGVSRAGKSGASTPLMHELVALALRIGKGREEEFRREFQALLRRYVDVG